MLMVALSFISIHKFVFLFARLWDITPWSLVLKFALQFQFKFQFQFRVHIVSPRSFWKILFFRPTIWPMFHSTLHVCGKIYDQTPHSDRFCPVCNSRIIEDEFHFLSYCPKHSIPRKKNLQSNPTQFCRF